MKFIAIAAVVLSIHAIAFPAEVVLQNPVTLTIVVDRLEIVSEDQGLEVGTDRAHVSRFRFSKPIAVETSGVSIAGIVRFDAEVAQTTAGISAADGTGKQYDAMTGARQSFIARREALAKLRPALVSAKEKAGR